MIREKKHFPRFYDTSQEVYRFILPRNIYKTDTGVSYGRRDVLNSIRPNQLPTRRGRGDTFAARIKFLWTKCLHRTPLHRCGPVANGSAH